MADPAYPDALPTLSRLHWYVIERVLGQGGFGITYLARDTNLDQPVAIKEYLPVDVATRMPDTTIRARTDDLRDRYRWGLERFIQEARTLARFDHPNIVRVQSVFEFNNTAYMVMRFEKGMTLSAVLDRRGTLPERDLLRVILPILDGLALVHDAGFIHRDVKPDNIHIDDDGSPVLLDFGSARQALGSSHTLTILIAPGYAPFEQYYSDSTSQGPWTDIYGLGATCYRAIAGRPPLDAVSRSKGILGSTQEVMVAAGIIGAGRYSGKFLAAVDHALAFAEKDRPQSIAAWRAELVAGETQPPVVTEKAPARPKTITPAATAVGTAAAPRTASDAQPRQAATIPPLPRTEPANPSAVRRPLMLVLAISAVVVAVGIAVYVATMQKGDETRGEVAALKKQLQDERAKQQADEKERQRKEEQKRNEQQKNQEAELAAKHEAEDKVRLDEQKRRDVAAAKLPAKDEAKPKPTPPTRATAPSSPPLAAPPVEPRVVPTPQPPVVAAAPPSASPEPAKPSPPRTAADQIADADRAIASKQYADALAILKPLADAGNAQAQLRLGNAYADGQGVTRDYAAARDLYDKAARQGEIGAELKLGAIYANATGVERNSNLAYVYYGMAARLGSAAAKPEMEKAAASLQPAEREQADRLIDNVVNKMPKRQ
jgi:serine/threonine protein kinase/TPR repeat protein